LVFEKMEVSLIPEKRGGGVSLISEKGVSLIPEKGVSLIPEKGVS
jgi:hypothetical protein